MDVAAILIEWFHAGELAQLHQALTAALPEAKLDPAHFNVGYSAHPALGKLLIVHLHDQRQGDLYDPLVTLVDESVAEQLGASVCGHFGDILDAAPCARTWTCLKERRTGGWSIYQHHYFSTESVDDAEDSSPFNRLAAELQIGDRDLLLAKLERPDLSWFAITAEPPAHLVAALAERLAI